MHDIQNKADIERLINTFYEQVRQDELLGPVFNDIAQVNWAHHLPVMYGFWEFLLLDNSDAYLGNPITKHQDLHQKIPLKPEFFDRWVAIFQNSVDNLFSGEIANTAKFRAFAIAETWKVKFSDSTLRIV